MKSFKKNRHNFTSFVLGSDQTAMLRKQFGLFSVNAAFGKMTQRGLQVNYDVS